MAQLPRSALPLQTLLLRLEREGFSFGVDKHLQLQRVLQDLGSEYVRQPATLQEILAPVLCRSREEQEKFYRIFGEYYEAEVQPLVDARLAQEKAKLQHEQQAMALPASSNRWLWPLIGGLLLALGVVFYLDYEPAPSLNPQFEVVTPDSGALLVGQPISFRNQTRELLRPDFDGSIRRGGVNEQVDIRWDFGDGTTNDSSLNPRHVYQQAGQFIVSLRISTYNPQTELISYDSIVARSLEISCPHVPQLRLQLPAERLVAGIPFTLGVDAEPAVDSLLLYWDLGDGTLAQGPQLQHTYPNPGGYQISLRAVRRHPLDQACSNEAFFSQSIHLAPPVEKAMLPAALPLREDPRRQEQAIFSSQSRWILSGVILGLFFLLEGLLFLLRNTSLSEEEQAKFSSQHHGPYTLTFPSQHALISPDSGIYALAKSLRKRREGNRATLDIPSSIRRTIAEGGLLHLMQRWNSRPSEYLVLIEQHHMDSHLTRLFSRITHLLREEDVLVRTFFFDQDPRVCWNEDFPEGLPLQALHQRFPQHRLIIYSHGHFMVDEYHPQLQPWIHDSLGRWEERLLVTPVPIADWGYQERLIYQAFRMLPADVHDRTSIHQVFEELERDDFDEYKRKGMQAMGQEQVRLAHVDFEQVEDLKAYLGGPLFEWLSATMVYPQPNWDVTLAIGKALSSHRYQDEDFLLTYEHLLKLARIPWLQTGMLPDTLRLALLDGLAPETERLARQTLMQLLDQVHVQQGSLAAKKLHIQQVSQQFFLTPGDEAIARKMYHLWKHNQLLDRSLSRRMEQPHNLLKGERASHYLQRRYQRFHATGAFARLLLALLAISLGLYGIHQFDRHPSLKDLNEWLPLEQTGMLTYIPQIDSAVYFNNRGVGRFFEGDTLGAQQDFIRAMDLQRAQEANYPLAARNLGLIYYTKGLDQYELAEYPLAIGLFEQAENALAAQAQNLEELGQVDTLTLYAWYGSGLSHYYLAQLDTARRLLGLIQAQQGMPLFDAYEPNLQTLLEGGESRSTKAQQVDEFWAQWLGTYQTAIRDAQDSSWQPFEAIHLLSLDQVMVGKRLPASVTIDTLFNPASGSKPPAGKPVFELNWQEKNGARGLLRFMLGDDQGVYWEDQPITGPCITGWYLPPDTRTRKYLRSQRPGEQFVDADEPAEEAYDMFQSFNFYGEWQNANGSQRPQRLSISPGKAGLQVAAYSNCKEKGCDWGRGSLQVNRSGQGSVRFDLGYVVYTLTLLPTKDENQLQARLTANFNDGRANQNERLTFLRLDQGANAPGQTGAVDPKTEQAPGDSPQQLPLQTGQPQQQQQQQQRPLQPGQPSSGQQIQQQPTSSSGGPLDTESLIPENIPNLSLPASQEQGYLWCLDAGHGRLQPGKRTPEFDDGTRLEEWEYNRDVVRRLKTLLEERGIAYYEVVPEVEVGSFLRERVERVNTLRVASDLQKILLSVHAKVVEGSWDNLQVTHPGIETFYLQGSESAERIGQIFHEYLTRSIDAPDGGLTGMNAKGAFYILRKTAMPAVLVETGGYTNQEEARRLTTDRYRQQVAEALADAIEDINANGYAPPPPPRKSKK